MRISFQFKVKTAFLFYSCCCFPFVRPSVCPSFRRSLTFVHCLRWPDTRLWADIGLVFFPKLIFLLKNLFSCSIIMWKRLYLDCILWSGSTPRLLSNANTLVKFLILQQIITLKEEKKRVASVIVSCSLPLACLCKITHSYYFKITRSFYSKITHSFCFDINRSFYLNILCCFY